MATARVIRDSVIASDPGAPRCLTIWHGLRQCSRLLTSQTCSTGVVRSIRISSQRAGCALVGLRLSGRTSWTPVLVVLYQYGTQRGSYCLKIHLHLGDEKALMLGSRQSQNYLVYTSPRCHSSGLCIRSKRGRRRMGPAPDLTRGTMAPLILSESKITDLSDDKTLEVTCLTPIPNP